MASGKIEFSDLVNSAGISEGMAKMVTELKATFEKLKTDLKSQAATAGASLSGNKGTSLGDYKKQATDINTVTLAHQNYNKIIEKESELSQKLVMIKSGSADAETKLKLAIQQETQIRNAELKVLTSLDGSMKQLNAQLELNRMKYRSLSQAERDNVAIGGKLLTTIQQQDVQIKKLDASMGNHQRNVRNYKSALTETKGTLSTLNDKFSSIKTGLLAFSGVAVAGKTILELYKKSMNSVEDSADELKAIIKGAEFATNAFFKTILQGDFSNLISNMNEAYEVGKKYEEQLDLLAHRHAALTYEEKAEYIALSELEEKLKSKDLSDKERLTAGEEWIKQATGIYERKKIYAAQEVKANLEALNLSGKTIEQQKALMEQYLKQDALNPKLRENAEKLNISLFKLAKDFGYTFDKTTIEGYTKAVNDFGLQAEKNTIKYAQLLKTIEGEKPEERIASVVEAMNKEKDAEIAFYQENKRIFGIISTLKKDKANESKELSKKEEEELKKQEDAFDAWAKKMKQMEDDLWQYRIDAMIEGNSKTIETERKRYENELTKLEESKTEKLLTDEEYLEAKELLLKIHNDKIDKINYEFNQKQIIQKEENKKDEFEYNQYTDKLEFEQKKYTDKEKSDFELKQLKEKRDSFDIWSKEWIDANIAVAEKEKSISDKLAEEKKKKEKDLRDSIIETSNEIISSYEKRSEKKIESLDKELSASKEYSDQLRELAKKQVEGATENLAFEQKKQAEIEKKKAIEEKKKKKMELGMAAITSFGKIAETDPDKALTKTVTEIVKLLAFVNSLPEFAEGVIAFGGLKKEKQPDDTLAKIGKGESVITAQATYKYHKELEAMQNLKYNPLDYLNIPLKNNYQKNISDYGVINEIQKLNETLKNKSEYKIDVNALTGEIVERITQKNTTIINNFKRPKPLL